MATLNIKIDTIPEYMSVYQSSTQVSTGGSVTLRARQDNSYKFVSWSDGVTTNPRTISNIQSDVILTATYKSAYDQHEIYQYRCYVKEQLSLTSKPKAFMVATSFTIRNDLLTKANSTIGVDEIPTNINNGDILVLYTPKGYKLYQGVITKVEENQIQCSQMQHFYAGDGLYTTIPNMNYIENEVYTIYNYYSQGYMLNSTYVDSIVASRLGGITLSKVDSTSGALPTKESNLVIDFEQFIYDLYNDYGIIFDFDIAYSGANTCSISVPNYTSMKIGNNTNAIMNLSPVTTIEETNRLIIYGSNGTYRTTYVCKTDGTIVEAPTSTALRFNVTNTKIVFSDDDANDLVKANLPTNMYNHKVTFDLLIKNNIYNYKDFKLGMPLAIFMNGVYFNSVLTGWEFSKKENADLTTIKMICGKVRTSLTSLILKGV